MADISKKKLVVGITQGDGNGIGYEVIIKSLADARIMESFTPVIYGSSTTLTSRWTSMWSRAPGMPSPEKST